MFIIADSAIITSRDRDVGMHVGMHVAFSMFHALK